MDPQGQLTTLLVLPLTRPRAPVPASVRDGMAGCPQQGPGLSRHQGQPQPWVPVLCGTRWPFPALAGADPAQLRDQPGPPAGSQAKARTSILTGVLEDPTAHSVRRAARGLCWCVPAAADGRANLIPRGQPGLRASCFAGAAHVLGFEIPLRSPAAGRASGFWTLQQRIIFRAWPAPRGPAPTSTFTILSMQAGPQGTASPL